MQSPQQLPYTHWFGKMPGVGVGEIEFTVVSVGEQMTSTVYVVVVVAVTNAIDGGLLDSQVFITKKWLNDCVYLPLKVGSRWVRGNTFVEITCTPSSGIIGLISLANGLTYAGCNSDLRHYRSASTSHAVKSAASTYANLASFKDIEWI